MNPLQQTERETITGGTSRLIPGLSFFVIICAVVLSWLFVKPVVSENNGFWIMMLWFLIVALAVGTLLLMGRASYRANYLPKSSVAMTAGTAAIVVILGTVTAFLSGDKFDAIRAAMISGILIVMGYRRRGQRSKTAL